MKMLLNLTYFLLVTLYFVKSCEFLPQEHRTVGVGISGCWPTTINEQQVLVEHKLSKKEANDKAHQAIAEDPENTICERAWWLFQGWTIKCTRAPFRGFDCGSGTHDVMWSTQKYKARRRGNLIPTEELDYYRDFLGITHC